MPQIFDKIGREKVREQLLETGFQLIKQYGLKKTSVADIAKKAGISTGTFYNFFSSKEEFVYQLVLFKRSIVKDCFQEMITRGKADKEAFRQFLRKIYLTDNDVFEYLSEGEIEMLKARWPEEYWKNQGNDSVTSQWLLSNLEGVRPDCDWRVFANLNKSISLIRHGRQRLHQDVYKETLDVLIDAIIRYVFAV